MNKADKIFLTMVILSACLLYIPSLCNMYLDRYKRKEVVVRYKNEVVLREDLKRNYTYQVKGSLGDVRIEVKDEKVRVEKETSPYHLCTIQGWVKDVNRPIVCLPNHIVVQIESNTQHMDDVDVVVQ